MVVGWYHSHPGFGCWLSGVDINTQQVYVVVYVGMLLLKPKHITIRAATYAFPLTATPLHSQHPLTEF